MKKKITYGDYKALALRVAKLQKTIDTKNSHISLLANMNKRWAKKLSAVNHMVPERVLQEFEAEAKSYKQRTRAEIDRLTGQVAVLTEKLVDIAYENTNDKFGDAQGETEITFAFAMSHDSAKPTKDDVRQVEMRLDSELSQRFMKHQNSN